MSGYCGSSHRKVPWAASSSESLPAFQASEISFLPAARVDREASGSYLIPRSESDHAQLAAPSQQAQACDGIDPNPLAPEKATVAKVAKRKPLASS
jgi:hypothetical protein